MKCTHCGEATSERLVQVSRPVVIGLFVLGFLLSWTLFGPFLRGLAEGNDRANLPLWLNDATCAGDIQVTVTYGAQRRTETIALHCGE